jgi:hypothetical protein
MEPVHEEHVGLPRRPKHDLGASGAAPAERMSRAVLWPTVRFCLDYPPDDEAVGAVVDQVFADTVPSDAEDRTSVESAG